MSGNQTPSRRNGRLEQYRDDDHVIKVQAGESRDHDGRPTSDFIIADRNDSSSHRHLVIDDRGDTIYDEYNRNSLGFGLQDRG